MTRLDVRAESLIGELHVILLILARPRNEEDIGFSSASPLDHLFYGFRWGTAPADENQALSARKRGRGKK
jgi:hypothetical protein